MDQIKDDQEPSLSDFISMDDEDAEFEPERLDLQARSADL